MPPAKQFVVGITGTIASGKSAVGKILAEKGIPVFDTDEIVHELLTDPTATREAVIKRFGDGIVNERGEINRKALGAIVFADESCRKDLEAIVHPAVIIESRRRVAKLPAGEICAILTPLLFEAGLKHEYDETWSVCADNIRVRERLMERDNLNSDQVENRLKAQWSQEKKASLADLVIDNSGTLNETAKQVEIRLAELRLKLNQGGSI